MGYISGSPRKKDALKLPIGPVRRTILATIFMILVASTSYFTFSYDVAHARLGSALVLAMAPGIFVAMWTVGVHSSTPYWEFMIAVGNSLFYLFVLRTTEKVYCKLRKPI